MRSKNNVSFLFIFCIMLMLQWPVYAENNTFYRNLPDSIEPKSEHYGKSFGNFNKAVSPAEMEGDTIYYVENNCIYKIKNNERNSEMVFDAKTEISDRVSVLNGYIYFYNDDFEGFCYRVKTDGTGFEKLFELPIVVGNINMVDNQYYYTSWGPEMENILYVDEGSGNKKQLYVETFNYLVTPNRILLICDYGEHESELISTDLEGNDVKTLAEDVSNFCYFDDVIYYSAFNSNKMISMDIDGKNKQEIQCAKTGIVCINATSDYIFYSTLNHLKSSMSSLNEIYRFDRKTNETIKIADDASTDSGFSVAGSWIYYIDFYKNILKRVSVDGKIKESVGASASLTQPEMFKICKMDYLFFGNVLNASDYEENSMEFRFADLMASQYPNSSIYPLELRQHNEAPLFEDNIFRYKVDFVFRKNDEEEPSTAEFDIFIMKNSEEIKVLDVKFCSEKPYQKSSFSDVDSENQYIEAIESLNALNIMQGYGQNVFKPKNNLTRAEFTSMLVRAMGCGADAREARSGDDFADVSGTDWFSGYIMIARQNGLIDGIGNGYFAPYADVTYEQAVKILVSSIGYGDKALSFGGYPDGYMAIAEQKGITKNTIRVDGAISREVAAQLIYNILTVPFDKDTQIDVKGDLAQSLLFSRLHVIKAHVRKENILDSEAFKFEFTDIDEVASENGWMIENGGIVNQMNESMSNLLAPFPLKNTDLVFIYIAN